MSQEPIKLNFNFATGGVDHTASVDETSDAIKIDENYVWSIQPISTGIVAGPPTYDVQISNDGILWDDYSAATTGVSVDNPVGDESLKYNYVRIKHISGTTSAGTVKYPINLKKV